VCKGECKGCVCAWWQGGHRQAAVQQYRWCVAGVVVVCGGSRQQQVCMNACVCVCVCACGAVCGNAWRVACVARVCVCQMCVCV